MADEAPASINSSQGHDLDKDPVFLLMVTGQIESAEVISIIFNIVARQIDMSISMQARGLTF